MNASGWQSSAPAALFFDPQTERETSVAILIRPIIGDAAQGPDPRDEKKRHLAEQAERRRIEVQDAIAANNLLRMASLWFDRRQHLYSDRCEESVRDMTLLTPELAHAAHERNLAFNAILRVRTLWPTKDTYTSAPVLQLLAAAAIQIENLQFALEAQERAAKAKPQAVAVQASPDLGTNHQAAARADRASHTSSAPSVEDVRSMMPKILDGLRTLLRPSQEPLLGSLATSQAPAAVAIRWGRQHLEPFLDRLLGAKVPIVRLNVFSKTITSTSATAMVQTLCQLLIAGCVDVRARGTELTEKDASLLATEIGEHDFARLERQIQVELDLLQDWERTTPPEQARPSPDMDATASPPEPGVGTAPVDLTLTRPILREGQLPARVLVTLLTNNGAMLRRDLHRLHSRDGSDAPRIANLLTPKGDLGAQGLIDAADPVALTEKGRREAMVQKARGTKPLGEDDSRLAHD